MAENTLLNVNESLDKLDRIIFDYYFSLSSIAASKGQYSLASNYLSRLMESGEESTRIFELQAKIAAQQGRFREAEFLWKKCLTAEPENAFYLSALNRLTKLQRSQAIRYSLVLKFVKFLAILFFFFFLFYLVIYDRTERRDQIALIVNKHDAISLKIDSLVNSKETKNELLVDIRNKINTISDISIHENDMKLILTFNEGLFSRGIDVKSNQIETIHQLSNILTPFAGKIIVEIIGSSDDIPITNNKQFSNNEELNLSRARAVYDLIYEGSRIPREDLMIGSLSELNSFYPNDGPKNRLRNRTVIIKIVQK
ncbi:MAG: hypothetical protein HQ565_08035 [Bacteroidetes bacterium]|nr:hypothetical protein [Bacteroidota bacterium]